MIAGTQILAEPATAYVLLWSRSFIGLVFVFSLLGKVRSSAAYARFLDSADHLVRPLPGRALAPLALLGEASAAVLLCFHSTAIAGFGCALTLLAAFTIVLAKEYRQGSRVSCNCFGSSRVPIGRLHLVRNTVLLIVAAGGLAICWSAGAVGAGPAEGVAAALVVGSGSALLIPAAEVVHDLLATSTIH